MNPKSLKKTVKNTKNAYSMKRGVTQANSGSRQQSNPYTYRGVGIGTAKSVGNTGNPLLADSGLNPRQYYMKYGYGAGFRNGRAGQGVINPLTGRVDPYRPFSYTAPNQARPPRPTVPKQPVPSGNTASSQRSSSRQQSQPYTYRGVGIGTAKSVGNTGNPTLAESGLNPREYYMKYGYGAGFRNGRAGQGVINPVTGRVDPYRPFRYTDPNQARPPRPAVPRPPAPPGSTESSQPPGYSPRPPGTESSQPPGYIPGPPSSNPIPSAHPHQYGKYGQKFGPRVAADFNQWHGNTQGMDPTQRGLAFHKHMKDALAQGRFSEETAAGYQGLVDAYNRGEVTAEEALQMVHDYINRHADSPAAKKSKPKIGKPAAKRTVSARLFSKGGAVDKKTAKPKPAAKKAAPKRAVKQSKPRALSRSAVKASRRSMPGV